MTSCRVARNWILRELDRDLSVDEALALDEHIGRCADCRLLHERATAVEELVHKLAEPPIARIDVERNVRGIWERVDAVADRPRPRRVKRLATLAAIVVALLVAWLARPRAVDQSQPIASDIRLPVPAPVTETSAAVGVEAEPLDDQPSLDEARMETARAELRALLANASSGLPALATTEQARRMADDLDAACRGSMLASWPVLRIAAGAVSDADPTIARAALRYLGVRGDRLAARTIEERAHGELGREAVLALLDLGDDGCDAIARALRDGEVGAFTIVELDRWPAERAVRALDSALRRAGASDDLLRALSLRGAAAVRTLVALERDGVVDRAGALERLAATPQAERVFGELLAGSERVDEDFALAACARLQPLDALPWLAERCRDSKSRDAALACLGAYAHSSALELLLDLKRERWISDDELEIPVRARLARGPEPLAAFAHECVATNSSRACVLLDALVEAADPAASAGLIAFVDTDRLAEEERELAARALGDLGNADSARELARILHGLDARHRRLAAACVDSIHRLGGDEAVSDCLAGAPRRCTERVLAVLRQRSPQAVSLVQLARALDPVLDRGSPANLPTRP